MAAAARPGARLRLPGDLLAGRLTEWADAGVFEQLHLQVLDRLGERGRLDWSRAAVDTMSMRAKRGGPGGRKSRRSWQAWKQAHLVCDDGGVPMNVVVTAANVNDTTIFEAVVEDIPPIRTPAGRRRTRPANLHADKGYDSRANRVYLRRRGITARIARRQLESSARLGRHRWKVERSLSWLSCFGRLQVRWDRDAGRWFGFVLVACALTCFKRR